MKTPWGTLGDLNLADHDIAIEILSADKHQLVEGLVVECLFDQIVANVPVAGGRNVIALDVDTVVVDTGRKTESWLGFVWARNMSDGLGRYLIALERCLVPYIVVYRNGEFMAARVRNGQRELPWQPLPELMLELSGGRIMPFRVDASVKNRTRQRQAFWGFISDFYKDRLGDRVVLPRILINCAIQPYFRAVWNLDRIFIVDNDVWLFEIKHKFPIDRRGLHFGINNGELGVLNRLVGAGIRCLHTILVKPYWSKEIGSMYLLNDLNMRARAAIIATVLDKSAMSKIMGQQSGRSGAHTSITGASGLQFKSLPATDFKKLGLLSDRPTDVAGQMSSAMLGLAVDPTQDAWLRALRAQDVERS
ncbi:hypothetical protein [Burkholderia sp. Bp8990]|uniref:hypothetical protein n=1 Tax=Burkholderia sp. Bp8990 TaxID=2184552 RepID=UPI000F59252E|nr:hypothetical protein [Burkholderia sp. Bp8990]RQS42127.1 hypothetical protein DIE01_10740 [Burkholderia sp. Bp8990]